MNNSAANFVKSYLNKKNINSLKKITNIKYLIILIVATISIIAVYYFLRPTFFDYNTNKKIIEKKVSEYLKINSSIKGDISFSLFPSPRIIVKNLEAKFGNSKDKPVIFDESNFIIAISKLSSIKEIKINKFNVNKQKIKIHPEQLKKYIEYFQKNDVDNFLLRDTEIFFVDAQNNLIAINNFNLNNTFDDIKEKISIKGVFSQNKFKLKFINKKNQEKYLDFSVPNLNTNFKIIFDKESDLQKKSGKLNLKIVDNILILNFIGDNFYEISNSFFRNKFLNSKLYGKVNFKDNFYFDLNFNINQVNFRKLFLNYVTIGQNSNKNIFNISKKINGKANVKINQTETFFGKVGETNFVMLFENGDLKIKSGSINLGKKGKSKFTASILGQGKDQRINFFINFLSEDSNDILKKMNLNMDLKSISFNAIGTINIMENKIKFKNLTVNNEKIVGRNLVVVENSFNQNVIKDNSLGFFDFFKIKKFIFEANQNIQ